MVLEMLCSICSKKFLSMEPLSFTNCGHVFHTECLTNHKIRSMNCPECSTYMSGIRRIYLEFGDSAPKPEYVQIKKQLEQTQKMKLDLQQQLTETLRMSEEVRCQLNDMQPIHQMLEEENGWLKEVNECLEAESRELDLKNAELRRLLAEAGLEGAAEVAAPAQTEQPDTLTQLNERIASLEKQLSQMDLKSEQGTSSESETSEKQSQQNADIFKRAQQHKIVIKGLTELKTPLHVNVLILAQQLHIKCYHRDIKSVCIDHDSNRRDSRNENVHKFALMVEFHSFEVKDMFLKLKEMLHRNPSTRGYTIIDCSNNLFAYAQQLKSIGYKYIYSKDRMVFAKKSNNSRSVKIPNQKAVDKLMREHKPANLMAEQNAQNYQHRGNSPPPIHFVRDALGQLCASKTNLTRHKHNGIQNVRSERNSDEQFYNLPTGASTSRAARNAINSNYDLHNSPSSSRSRETPTVSSGFISVQNDNYRNEGLRAQNRRNQHDEQFHHSMPDTNASKNNRASRTEVSRRGRPHDDQFYISNTESRSTGTTQGRVNQHDEQFYATTAAYNVFNFSNAINFAALYDCMYDDDELD